MVTEESSRPVRGRYRRLVQAWFHVEPSGSGLVAAAPTMSLRAIISRFAPETRPYRWWIALGVAVAAVVPAIETAEIWLFKLVVDDVLTPRDLGALGPIAAGYVALALAGAVLGGVDRYLSTWIGERFTLDVRSRVFEHVQQLSATDIDRRRIGDLVTRLDDDVAAIETVTVGGAAQLLSAAFRIVFFTTALIVLDWQLAAIVAVFIPLTWWLTRTFSRLIRAASRERRRLAGSIGSIIEESLSNATVVQAYNLESAEACRIRGEGEAVVRAELASARIKAAYSPLVDLVELAAALAVIGLGTWAVADGRLTVGGLLVFLAYLTQLLSPVRSIGSLVNSVMSAAAAADRVIELLDEAPRVVDGPEARRWRNRVGYIDFDRVSFRYPGADRPALDDVCLSIRPGETVAVVGPSGAGKSTLAKLLLRFHDPDHGVVRLDGHDVRDLTRHSIRDGIATLWQETLVFQASIRHNIACGSDQITDDRIEQAARVAGIHEFIAGLPDGYDTPLDARGRNLSGGQRQRIAIARALARPAPIVVLDEPTTGLDGATRRHLLEPLRALLAGRTALVISHDLLTVQDADRIVVLDRGRIVEQGTHDDLLAAGGVYARLFAERASQDDEPSYLAGKAAPDGGPDGVPHSSPDDGPDGAEAGAGAAADRNAVPA